MISSNNVISDDIHIDTVIIIIPKTPNQAYEAIPNCTIVCNKCLVPGAQNSHSGYFHCACKGDNHGYDLCAKCGMAEVRSEEKQKQEAIELVEKEETAAAIVKVEQFKRAQALSNSLDEAGKTTASVPGCC